MKVDGKNHQSVLTGQVTVQPPACAQHRETLHGEGEHSRWCNRCGWHVPERGRPVQRGRGNGGWI